MDKKQEDLKLWIDQYSLALLKRAIYLVSNQQEAEDLVQEVFIAAFSSYERYKQESTPKTWLMGILNHKVADFYRKKYQRNNQISLNYFFDEKGSWKEHTTLQDWNETNLDKDEELRNQVLEDCIEMLPQKWMIPVKLYYLEEKKTTFVCQETGITTTNLWKILQRSRLQLRECLEKNWYNQ